MLSIAAMLAHFEWSPASIAAFALPLGGAVYGAVLYFGGDRTFHSLLALGRAYASSGPKKLDGTEPQC